MRGQLGRSRFFTLLDRWRGAAMLLPAVTTAAAFTLAGRISGRSFLGRAASPDVPEEALRSGMSHVAGLAASFALAAPGLLAIPARCRRRPVKLRLFAAFGVFHVRFPRAAQVHDGMQQALTSFCVAARIPAPCQIAKFFLNFRNWQPGRTSRAHAAEIFSKQVFAFSRLLFISAAHQRSRLPAAPAGE